MAEFTASPTVDPNVDPVLANTYNFVQKNSLANIGTQQDLADRQTFRDSAPGLVARDPAATGQAMGANPAAAQAFLSSIPNMDQNARQQAQSDMEASSSLAGAIGNLPADQRAAGWAAGRQTLIASGHKMVPPEQYPGDYAMQVMRNLGLTAQQQFDQTGQMLAVNPQPPLQSTPGGGYVGPGGVQGQQPGATGIPPPSGQESSQQPTSPPAPSRFKANSQRRSRAVIRRPSTQRATLDCTSSEPVALPRWACISRLQARAPRRTSGGGSSTYPVIRRSRRRLISSQAQGRRTWPTRPTSATLTRRLRKPPAPKTSTRMA